MQRAKNQDIEHDGDIQMTTKENGISMNKQKLSKNIYRLRAHGLIYLLWLHGTQTKISQEKTLRHFSASSDKQDRKWTK